MPVAASTTAGAVGCRPDRFGMAAVWPVEAALASASGQLAPCWLSPVPPTREAMTEMSLEVAAGSGKRKIPPMDLLTGQPSAKSDAATQIVGEFAFSTGHAASRPLGLDGAAALYKDGDPAWNSGPTRPTCIPRKRGRITVSAGRFAVLRERNTRVPAPGSLAQRAQTHDATLVPVETAAPRTPWMSKFLYSSTRVCRVR